jgi:pyrimidine operon attenuation protein/uracil phosphoribosyltransferase
MQEKILYNPDEVNSAVERLAEAIFHTYGDTPLALVGIQTRGVILADRIYAYLSQRGVTPEQGTLDISLYRDDLSNLAALPKIMGSDIPFEVEGATVILCDDVLFTGRTIRAAMNLLLDYGRPERIELAVLADRGHRELPIAATYCGMTADTQRSDYLRVHFKETDEVDRIVHYQEDTP